MRERPYFRYLTKQLIEEVERKRDSETDLHFLIREIGQRKKAKSKLEPSLVKAKKYLADIEQSKNSYPDHADQPNIKDNRKLNTQPEKDIPNVAEEKLRSVKGI